MIPLDETKIIEVIASKPRSIKDVANALKVSRRVVGAHLKSMAERNQVHCKMDYNDGREKIYYV